MSDERRAIELEVEVTGTPEQVWEAIATGPGISSWYVPHTVEEREGGAATATFGARPEMEVSGRVAAWEPPRRIVFDGGEDVAGEDVGGMAFEWTVEALAGGRCVVRLVNSGFGSGETWDAQYDAMTGGWRLFLLNLRLHLEHFGGQQATTMLPTAPWAGSPDAAWETLATALGIGPSPTAGDRLDLGTVGGPSLAGTVVDAAPRRLALLVQEPAPGTAFVAVESHGPQVVVSVWAYLYGPDRAVVAARDLPRWQRWLDERAGGGARGA